MNNGLGLVVTVLVIVLLVILILNLAACKGQPQVDPNAVGALLPFRPHLNFSA